MAETQTQVNHRADLIQDGSVNNAGLWIAGTLFGSAGGTHRLGFRWQLPVDAAGNAHGFRATHLTLTSQTTTTSALWQVYIEPAFDPAAYTSTDRPLMDSRGELQVSEATITVGIDDEFTFVLGSTWDGSEWTEDATFLENLNTIRDEYWAHSSWSGITAFALLNTNPVVAYPVWYGSADDTAKQAAVLSTDWQFHTGFLGWPVERGRAKFDMRTGEPALTSELMRDGFSEGLWVLPENWDEEDHVDRYRVPPDEGKITDEVP